MKNHELWSSAVGSVAVPLTSYDISGKILHLSVLDFLSIKERRERHTHTLAYSRGLRKHELLFLRPTPVFKILWGISPAIILNANQALEKLGLESEQVKQNKNKNPTNFSRQLRPQALAPSLQDGNETQHFTLTVLSHEASSVSMPPSPMT